MLKSRALRLLSWLLLALGLLLLAAWLALPPLLKWQLETRGSEALGRDLRVGEVHFAPFTLALTLGDLSVGAAAGAADTAPQLQIERLFIDLDVRSLLRLAPVVQALQVDAPKLRLARLADGRYDVDDLLQRLAPKPDAPPPGEPARFALFNLRLAGGEFTFDDRPVARSHALREILLDLPFLSNLPADVQIKVEPRLAFIYNDSRFDSQGRSTPFAKGRASEFDMRFDKLALAPLWAYAPATLPVRGAGGQLSADIKLRFEQPEQGDPSIDVQGALALADTRVQPPAAAADAPLLAWRNLSLKLASLQPFSRTLDIDELRVDGAVLHVRRDANGQLQLLQLVPKPAAAAPVAPETASAPARAASGAAAAAGSGGWQIKLGTLRLDNARVHWLDTAVKPAVDWQLDGIALQLSSLSWPMRGDAQLQFEAALLDQGRKAGQLRAAGPLTDRQARIDVALAGIDLGIFDPYLSPYLQPQASARLDAAATVDWARGDAPKLALAVSSLRVDDVRLGERAAASRSKPAQAKPLAQLARLEVADLRADLLQRQVDIGTVSLQDPFADLARDASGRLNASQWLVAEKNIAPAPLAESAAAAPWRLQLREARLEGGRVRYADAALDASPLEVSNLRLQAQGLAWPPAPAPLATQASATLSLASQREGSATAPLARLDWRGKVGLQPASADGTLTLQRFPVHVFEPFFGEALPVQLQRLEAGFQGQLQVRQTAQGLAARIGGDALLADLRVLALDAAPATAAGAPAELLTWNALNLNGLKLNLQPGAKPAIELRELRLADFFARLEVSEQGRFNLQTVATGRAAASASAPADTPAAPPPAAAASAPVVAGGQPGSVLSRLPVELLVESMQFVNGRVDFNDRFVRPNFRADLTELNGQVGRLDSRSRDMATLQFNGRVAGTGLLDIGGALNPTVLPPALDLKAKATDIELAGLTPYSSKYAGYPIERGKLSVDVAYKIEADGKLEASNQIIVNQLTFGAKVDSPQATKLPVPLTWRCCRTGMASSTSTCRCRARSTTPSSACAALIRKVIVNFSARW